MLEILDIHHFEKYLNEEFEISFGDSPALVAHLTDVRALSSDNVLARDSFSLLFTTDQTTEYYTQGISEVRHARLGTMHLFLVPVGPDADTGRMRYEATFN